MTIALVGEVASTGDTIGDYTTLNGGANLSGDDDLVQGTGAPGDKMSGTTELLASDNLTSTYDFSVGGTHEGWHFIGWINTKTPVNATSGIGVYVGDSVASDLGVIYAMPASFYKGGFITRVMDMAADFDTFTGFTAAGNPAQLTTVDQLGFQFVASTTLMGNFNNMQTDQFTVGLGVRADVGTLGTPNTMEAVRAQDEDTSKWGWWSKSNGSFIGKAKLFIGPATGDVASWFVDTAFKISFADENVAVGFYEFPIRGGNTTVEWNLANISAANPANARWGIAVDSGMGATTGGFDIINCTLSGSDVITLNANTAVVGTTFIDGNSIVASGATFDACTFLAANTADGVAWLIVADPSDLTGCTFEFSDGHAMELTIPGTYTFSANQFTGYGAAASNDAAIYNNSGGAITLNITDGGSIPTIRNGTSATTSVVSSVALTLTGIPLTAEITVVDTAATPNVLFHVESSTTGTEIYSFDGALSGDPVVVMAIPDPTTDGDLEIMELEINLPATSTSLQLNFIADRAYSNP